LFFRDGAPAGSLVRIRRAGWPDPLRAIVQAPATLAALWNQARIRGRDCCDFRAVPASASRAAAWRTLTRLHWRNMGRLNGPMARYLAAALVWPVVGPGGRGSVPHSAVVRPAERGGGARGLPDSPALEGCRPKPGQAPVRTLDTWGGRKNVPKRRCGGVVFDLQADH